jgi:ribosomal protein S18 acetylase RimI-like enzyme
MIITYQPITGVSATSTRHYEIDELTLSGMIFAGLQLIGAHRIVFERDNKEIIDLQRVSELDFTNLYQTNEFLYGIREMSFLLGVDPSILVEGWTFDYKLQKIILPNNTWYANGTTVDINELDFERRDNMSPLLNKCFPEASSVGITVPCTMYLYLQNDNLVAVTMATDSMPHYLSYLDGWYLFNVCTDSHYQGRGIAKSLLICAINDLISLGVRSLILEVNITNIRAYRLYTTLGFVKIKSIKHDGKIHDVLQLLANL